MGTGLSLSRISGHRGAPSLAPENTLAGFEAARLAGAKWTETDVCVLGDGTPVMFHDDSLDRCTNRSGTIEQLARELGRGKKSVTARLERLRDPKTAGHRRLFGTDDEASESEPALRPVRDCIQRVLHDPALSTRDFSIS